MRIAVEGCMHGDLDNVYSTILHLEKVENTKIDLLICCGDFQAVRNNNDLESLNVPSHYRSMNSFWKYYSGQVVAPIPTVFIGGNHEASNYLWELYYGGWAAPNVYFLGFAGIIKFGNIRIGGISGIYNPRHYYLGHYERPPYNNNDIRSIYHVREYDVYKLMQVKEQIDIFVSHDWPRGITDYGNWEQLIQQKPYFEKEINERTLGSKAAAELLDKLKPPYWFSAHLHCKFPAIIQHGEGGPITKFLALDKCIPGRCFMQILDIESDLGPYEIQYDEEWLTITKKLNCFFPLTRQTRQFGAQQVDLSGCRDWIREKVRTRGCKPFDFVQTVPSYDPLQSNSKSFPGHCRNPQTELFLQLLELPYLLDSSTDTQGPIKSLMPLNSSDKIDHTLDYGDEYIDIDNLDGVEDLVDED